MATSLVVNGVSFSYPNTGDQSWGDQASAWAAAVTTGMLQKAGGAFTLTAEVNFGATFGLLSPYFKSGTVSPASTGVIRLSDTDAVSFRNHANSADIALSKNTSDQLTWAGAAFLSSSGVLLGAAMPALTGDVTSSVGSTATTVAFVGGLSASSIVSSVSLLSASQAANKVFSSPNGSAGAPSFRSLVGADLPNPSASTLGGVQSIASVSHQWVSSISTSGVPSLSQPAFTDISGSVAASQLPNPSATTLGGIQSAAAVSHQWINSISTLGVPSLSQPAFTDISGSVAASQLPNPSATTLGGVQSAAAVSHQWISSISTLGVPSLSQPAFTDISGSVAASQMPALTGDVTTSAGAVATTIAGNTVTNAKLATMAAHTYKGNNTASTGAALDLTQTQLTAELNQFTSSLQGVVPGSGGGSTNFLRADGTWAIPAPSVALLNVSAKTGAFTLTTANDVVTASGGAFTLTLPTAVGNTGKVFYLKKTDSSSTNIITIGTTSSQTIDGLTTQTLRSQYESITVVSDGANWNIL